MYTGKLQVKTTQKGTTYFYMLIRKELLDGTYTPYKWEATSLPVKGNKRKAQNMLKQRLIELNGGQSVLNIDEDFKNEKPVKTSSIVSAQSIFFSEWIEKWLNNKEGTIRASTLEGYKLHAKHIISYFSEKKILLGEISYKDIDDYCIFMLKEGKINRYTRERSGLSIRTVRSHKFLITSALQKAVLYGYIEKNPAEGVRVTNKKNHQLAKKPQFFTYNEAQKYLEFLKETHDILYDFIKATLIYGLRKSEALGLTTEALDFKNHKLYINRTVVKIVTIHDENATKTFDSDREYPLTPAMEQFWKRVLAKKKENQLFYGNKYISTEFLFTWDDGKPFSPDYVYHHHKKMVEKFGRPGLTVHNLRHSTASILMELGWTAKDIQEWLGHADYSTTMNIYTHISKTLKREKALDLNEIIEQGCSKNRTNENYSQRYPLQPLLKKIM